MGIHRFLDISNHTSLKDVFENAFVNIHGTLGSTFFFFFFWPLGIIHKIRVCITFRIITLWSLSTYPFSILRKKTFRSFSHPSKLGPLNRVPLLAICCGIWWLLLALWLIISQLSYEQIFTIFHTNVIF